MTTVAPRLTLETDGENRARGPGRCQWGTSLLAAGIVVLGCDAPIAVGEWKCASAPLFIPPDGSPLPAGKDLPVASNWSTGFEDGFCGYIEANGFCYGDSDARHYLVASPVRSGRRAAAFAVTTSPQRDGRQTRCVREGTLPEDAYYGAWFYVPRGTVNNGNWNLMHFRGSDDTELRNLWDVSVETREDGSLVPRIAGYVGSRPARTIDTITLPRDTWFSLLVRLRRADTPTGAVALYVNGQQVFEQSALITDDSTWGQWYVGNLATDLTPEQSTIYVDDVTISDSLPTQP